MSKKIKITLSFLVLISVTTIGLIGYAQPNIPKENIPADIPTEVREQIERLYSSDPVGRGYAAYHLGEMGEQAAPAVPFLIEISGNNVALGWTWGGGYLVNQLPLVEKQ